jgi:hypothetical protein
MLGQESQALQCGFKTAMCGALRQGALCETAGATAGNLASQGTQNLTNIAKLGACIATTCQNLALQRINALQNMGTAQQTICQNRQLFPLSTLCRASKLLSGYQIPTSQQTTATTSPLGAIAGLGATAAGLFCSKNGPSVASSIGSALCALAGRVGSLFGNSSTGASTPSYGCMPSASSFYNQGIGTCVPVCTSGVCYGGFKFGSCATNAVCLGFGFAEGGQVHGCASTTHRGALPRK